MLKLCKSTTKKWNMQIYPTKSFIFVCFCMWIIHFSPQIGRIGRILDGVNNWQQLANNYFFALLREAGNEESFVNKDQKWYKKSPTLWAGDEGVSQWCDKDDRRLFYLLSWEGVGFVTAEDEDLLVEINHLNVLFRLRHDGKVQWLNYGHLLLYLWAIAYCLFPYYIKYYLD